MSKLRKYIDSSPEFEEIRVKYAQFVENLDKPGSEAVRVFEPLPQKALDELALIRDISKYLQKKKEEDLNKAAQAAEAEAEEQKAKKAKEELSEESEIKKEE